MKFFILFLFSSLSLFAEEFKAAEATASDHGKRALAASDPAIVEADLRRYVTRLASEEYEGRGTGDKGERMATAYLAAFFEELGLQKAGEEGSYYQNFSFPAGMELKGENSLSFPAEAPPGVKPHLMPGEHYQPLSLSSAAEVEADAVFAGFGIASKNYDSFEGLEVKGKWIVVFRGHPEKRKDLARFGPLVAKATIAKSKGAAGIIYVKGTNPAISSELIPPNAMVGGQGQILPAITITDQLAASLLTGEVEREGLKTLFDSYRTEETRKGFALPHSIVAKIGIAARRDAGRNVIARLGTGEAPSKEAIVIGAHIDHLGYGNRGGSRAKGEEAKEIHFGADDNASGVAAMMELAQFFADQKKAGKLTLKRDLIFAGWSGEELGLHGSRHYVTKAKEKAGDDLHSIIAAYLNLDMVGRAAEGGLTIQGIGSSMAWPEILEKADATDLKLKRSHSPYLPTDTTPFYNAGVPILAAFTGLHKDYHTPRDTIDTVDFAGLDKVTRYVRSLAVAVANHPETPGYVKVARGRQGGAPKVRIGVRPEDADSGGVKLAQVTANSPASRAGLRDGDVLKKFDGAEVKDMEGLFKALRKSKAGQEYDIVVQRGEETVKMKLTPEKR